MSGALERAGLLRQRNVHHSNDEMQNNKFNNDVHIATYKPKSKSNKRTFWPLLVGVGLVVILCMQFKSKANSSAAKQSNNLKLITVYPWPVAATIHNIEGQTELLISNDNRKAVEAVRTTIGMANSLRRKRRPKSILLKFTGFIARLGSEDSNTSGGDIELESYGEMKIRQYLLDHGEKCNDEIFHHYNELIDSIMSAGDDDERINSLWAHAVSLFTWCQLANEDARGYIAHGTFLKTDQILEESRLKGIGIIGGDTSSSDEMHYSQLFVIPNQTSSGAVISRDLSMEVLHAHLTQSPFHDSPQNPLLLGIHDRDLERWTSERWIQNDGKLNGDWLLLK